MAVFWKDLRKCNVHAYKTIQTKLRHQIECMLGEGGVIQTHIHALKLQIPIQTGHSCSHYFPLYVNESINLLIMGYFLENLFCIPVVKIHHAIFHQYNQDPRLIPREH